MINVKEFLLCNYKFLRINVKQAYSQIYIYIYANRYVTYSFLIKDIKVNET